VDRASILSALYGEEAAWAKTHPEGGDADHWGLIQYPLERFATLCDAATEYLSWNGFRSSEISFLEVGCGIATKAAYAKMMHGISVFGIDREAALVELAGQRGIHARTEDAADFQFYDEFSIIYVNHPFRDPHMQLELDWKIQREMHSGALFIGVNQAYGSQPPMNWKVVYEPENWPVHGVWQKP
jgi:SAM-dependent methyltransferase